MRILLYIVAACLVVRALQLAVAGLVVALAIAFVIGFVTRPRETLGMIIASAGWMLLERYPAQTICGIAALSALSWIEVAVKKALAKTRAEGEDADDGALAFDPPRLPPP